MRKYKKIGNDYYVKVGTVRRGKVYDSAGKSIGEVGAPQKIERNVETEIIGGRESFKIINDKVFDSRNKSIGRVAQYKSMVDGYLSKSELADFVALVCLLNLR